MATLDLEEYYKSALYQPRREQISIIVFSPDGLSLASGSTGGTLQLWGAVFSIPVATLKGHQSCIVTITFSPDGLHLASRSYDSIWLWDTTSRAPIAKLDRPG
jgi:WD40 repeat protein